MAKNNANIRVYGGDNGGVWVAPKGTTAPTDLAAPSTPWAEVGWLSDNGIELEQKADKKKFYAWQGGTVVKVSVSKAERTFTIECLEETAAVLGLIHPGLTFTTTGVAPNQIAKGTVPGGITSVEKAFIIDAEDSDGHIKRYNVPDGSIDPSTKVSHKFDDLTVYTFVVDVLGDFDIVTNSPGVVGP